MKQAMIINVGDELLSGKTVNTNLATISRFLRDKGIQTQMGCIIRDQRQSLLDLLQEALNSAKPGFVSGQTREVGWIFITGGLGPTQDDITREIIAAFLSTEVEDCREGLKNASRYLNRPVEELSEHLRRQCQIPRGTEPLLNEDGIACGFTFQQHNRRVFVMPGVPRELESMLQKKVTAFLDSDGVLLRKALWTFGWPESQQKAAFTGWQLPEGWAFSSLPSYGGVNLSLSFFSKKTDEAKNRKIMERLWKQMMTRIPEEVIVDQEEKTLPACVNDLLSERHLTLSVAESCSSGALAYLITEIPGSSAIFQGGFLTYSNQAKTSFLGVDSDLLNREGAVSEPVVFEMVKGVLDKSGADYGCAISGIAGPGGGTPDKPVGTVWLAAGNKEKCLTQRVQLSGDREAIRWKSAYAALNLLKKVLQEKTLAH